MVTQVEHGDKVMTTELELQALCRDFVHEHDSYETTHVMHDTQAWAELDADGWVTVEVTDGWSLMTRRVIGWRLA